MKREYPKKSLKTDADCQSLSREPPEYAFRLCIEGSKQHKRFFGKKFEREGSCYV
jgi:hypothetical protein